MTTPHGHETKDARIRPILVTIVALAAGAALVSLIVFGVYRWFEMGVPQAPANPMATSQEPPRPRVEEHPQIELHDLRREEEQRLSTYGWTDKSHTGVHIPIDRAMELQLERGYPVRKAAKQ
jgi:hypothetical protein